MVLTGAASLGILLEFLFEHSFPNFLSNNQAALKKLPTIMRLQYLLVMVVATLATSSGTASAARVLDNANLVSAEQVQPIDTVQTDTRSRRFLRTADTNIIHEPHVNNPDNKKTVFIEDKLLKALTNPRKNKKLYERWYNSGFTVKQVEGGLRQSESRELELVYKNLSVGYAKYFNRRRSQENK